ncbi:pantoate--beta-alanine ligase [Streptococcus henryi]|uniref:Pantothenate synthetase n=1 Tax=Streptococcus henryi TaxID=439219 RepID=A0A1G6CZJ3_9STRE|nr:pantoate--beta-alanine ligase [Streptococcus henryi]SDB38357.1 pantoate--beta-alanine ligase [Streptococcus henryi]
MKIVRTVEEVRQAVRTWKAEGKTIGLVPTMGYLHEGHKSLIDRAVAENDHVVVSIFVNPIQFGPAEDLETYPRDLEKDSELCQTAGASLIFHPDPSQMYSPTFSSFINMSTLTGGLCGKTRPSHFQGVCTVVGKLFNIVEPNKAYFGQKDAQQLAVIRHMVEDLNFNLEIVGCPIVREADGLAKSSRNSYLSKDERKAALVLSQSLAIAQKMINEGERDTGKLTLAMTKHIENEPLAKIDYIEFVDWKTLEPVGLIDRPVLNAIAVYIGKTRLIDNHIYE